MSENIPVVRSNTQLVMRTLESLNIAKTESATVFQTLIIYLGKTLSDIYEILKEDRSQERHMAPSLPEICGAARQFFIRFEPAVTELTNRPEILAAFKLARGELILLEEMHGNDPDDQRAFQVLEWQSRIIRSSTAQIRAAMANPHESEQTHLAITDSALCALYTYKVLLNRMRNRKPALHHTSMISSLLGAAAVTTPQFEAVKNERLTDRYTSVEGECATILEILNKEMR